MHTKVLPSFLALAATCSALGAAVVSNVAFDNTSAADSFTGAAVVGTAGDSWTAYDVAGAVEAIGGGISLQSAGSDYGDFYNTGASFGTYAPILTNYIYSSATLTLTLSGLAPASTYDITGIASLDGYFSSAKTFQAVGLNTVSSSLTNNSAATAFTDGVNYTTLVGVQPTAGGVITLTLESDVGLSALQISTIPEPSTYAALAGAMALGLVAWRRRR